MSEARYLVRFDDICPTMNWRVWLRIERVLRDAEVRPLLAIVPDNRDPHLACDPPRDNFWEIAVSWQAMGWSLALHGYQHVYVNANAGLMGITAQSEFAGLPGYEQARKLDAGLQIFSERGIRTRTWIAPSHSFDLATLELLSQRGIRVISDGFGCRPFTDVRGLVWIPCQLWEAIVPRSSGVWTVCYHHNGWNDARVEQFKRNVLQYRSQIVDLASVVEGRPWRPLTLRERTAAWIEAAWRFRLRRPLRRWRQSIQELRFTTASSAGKKF